MQPEDYVPPLGMEPHPARQDIRLKPGDRLLFYTDGLVETRDRAGRFLDLDDHVAAALAAPDLNAAIGSVVRLLLEHTAVAGTEILTGFHPRRAGPAGPLGASRWPTAAAVHGSSVPARRFACRPRRIRPAISVCASR